MEIDMSKIMKNIGSVLKFMLSLKNGSLEATIYEIILSIYDSAYDVENNRVISNKITEYISKELSFEL